MTLKTLEACGALVERQQEMLPLLGRALGVDADEVFYLWAARRCAQRGRLPNSSWQYVFHGHDCTLRNLDDGRCVPIYFGPGGTADTVGGVEEFIQSWPEYQALKNRFATGFEFHEAWDELLDERCLETADPALVKFLAGCTTFGPERCRVVNFPPGTPVKKQADCMVAHRQRISETGRRLLAIRRRGLASMAS